MATSVYTFILYKSIGVYILQVSIFSHRIARNAVFRDIPQKYDLLRTFAFKYREQFKQTYICTDALYILLYSFKYVFVCVMCTLLVIEFVQ